MPPWNEILSELNQSKAAHDNIRRKYLRRLAEKTGRNVIIYYSGWLQKRQLVPQGVPFLICDNDKNGLMTCVHKLDRSKGLDLILHTPGGEAAATESIVDYLRSMFNTNMRAIIPQLAMSAGTMIALACKEIIMGKHSSIGPIDPQLRGLPANGVIEEFERARAEIAKTPSSIPLWQPIIAKYHPTLIGECQKSIAWSNEMVKDWLVSGMFEGEADAPSKADKVIKFLGGAQTNFSHDRHISMDRAKECGLKIIALEDDNELQDLVLSVHHICSQTLTETAAYKIIENHQEVAQISQLAPLIIGNRQQ